MISSASSRINTVLLTNTTGEAQEENAQEAKVSADKDVYEGKVTTPAQAQAQAPAKAAPAKEAPAKEAPAKEAQAQQGQQAQACETQQGQQAQGAAKQSGFWGLFKRKPKTTGPSKREIQKQLDKDVKALVDGGTSNAKGAKGCAVSVAHLIPRTANAKGCAANDCKTEAANLHMLAKSVIKYTHTGLHFHAVSKCNATSALSVVKATLAEIEPYTVDTKECSADRHLKSDRKRLERHADHLGKKAARAAAQGSCANAKGIQEQCAAPAKAQAQAAATK